MKVRLSVPELEKAILDICSMIDGLEIAIERAKELRERYIFHHEPFSTSKELTESLSVLIAQLYKDGRELEEAKRTAQKALWAEIG